MAVALVGSLGTVNTGTTTTSPTFAQATTAGNFLVFWASMTNTAGVNLHPTPPSGWDFVLRSSAGSGGLNSAFAAVYCKPFCAAGESAPSITSADAVFSAGALGEFSGVATAPPFLAASNGGAGLGTVTLSRADLASGALLLACDTELLTKAGTITTGQSFNNGAAPSGNLNNDATSTLSHYRYAFGITTGNTVADTNTPSTSTMNLGDWEGVLLSAVPPLFGLVEGYRTVPATIKRASTI